MTAWFQDFAPEFLFAFKMFYRALVIFFAVAGLSSGWVFWYGAKSGKTWIRVLGGVFLLLGLVFCVPPYLRYQFHKQIIIHHHSPVFSPPASSEGR